MALNTIIICGRLVRDPEIRNTGSDSMVARYTVAVDRTFKREGEPDADFFNCTAFGKGAGFADKYLKQGMKVIVQGRMQSDNYTNKDGQKVYSWQLIVSSQEFAESKKAAEENGVKTSDVKTDANGYVEISDGIEEDLPFI
jgi:single-strand DNA-binding protein